jgi:hypothetical protein
MSRLPFRSFLLALAAGALMVGCTPDEGGDDPVTAAEQPIDVTVPRPPGVPVDFVPTPNGWRHRSCVISVGEGESVQADHVLGADGRRRPFAPCGYPAFDRQGGRLVEGLHQPTVSGWVASLNSASSGAIGYLAADWTVPSTAAVRQGQTLFFFPGLEPLATTDTILQPVLAWNGFGDNAWTIASWNCCKSGNVFHSTPVKVSAGHTLTGSMTGSNCSSAGACSSWKIVTRDDTAATQTSFPTTSYGEKLDWAFGGAMEVYGVNTCTEYPGNTSIHWRNIKAHDTQGHSILPAWSEWAAGNTVSPNCNVHFGTPTVSGTTSASTLSWKNL